jgi:hypothetical protein
MHFHQRVWTSVACAVLGLAAASGIAQTAVGPGAPSRGASTAPSAAASRFADSIAAAPSSIGVAFGPLANDAQGRAVLQQIEGKWGPLMREVFNWNADSFQQFYEGYKNYPLSVLQGALAATSYEAMQAELMRYATTLSQRNAALAFDFRKTRTEDLGPDALQLRQAAVKALGDDARDLVFTPTAPCTVWDTRFASGAPYAGAIGNGVTRRFYSHLLGGATSFSTYGGNSSCAENNVNFLGAEPYAVMMIVYVNNATANGWLSFYRDGDPDPSQATISVYYASGPTRTQAVIAKSSRGHGTGTYDVAVTGRFASADAAASVVGYFKRPSNFGNNTVTAANGNTALGALAMGSNSSGFGNTAMGTAALAVNTSGFSNTATGGSALSKNTFGYHNTGFGNWALRDNVDGNSSTAVGSEALTSNTSGVENTAVGTYALVFNGTGSKNIAIGTSAAYNNSPAASNNIEIGNVGTSGDSGIIRIGTAGEQIAFFAAGIRGVTTNLAGGAYVLVDANGQLGTASSSRRFKEDIDDMGDASSGLLDLRPVTFRYTKSYADGSKPLDYGLIAEEVADVYPNLVSRSLDGQIETVQYHKLTPMLLNELQKQERIIRSLEDRIEKLEALLTTRGR